MDWWDKFMTQFDGKAMLLDNWWTETSDIWATDSSGSGCGGWFRGRYFHKEYPAWLLSNKEIHINELECMAIVVALKTWGHLMKGKKCVIKCDNLVTVTVLTTGRAHNVFTQQCMREVAYLCAINNTVIKTQFIEGISNEIPDSLSRWSDQRHRKHFYKLTKELKTIEENIPDSVFLFDNDW